MRFELVTDKVEVFPKKNNTYGVIPTKRSSMLAINKFLGDYYESIEKDAEPVFTVRADQLEAVLLLAKVSKVFIRQSKKQWLVGV